MSGCPLQFVNSKAYKQYARGQQPDSVSVPSQMQGCSPAKAQHEDHTPARVTPCMTMYHMRLVVSKGRRKAQGTQNTPVLCPGFAE